MFDLDVKLSPPAPSSPPPPRHLPVARPPPVPVALLLLLGDGHDGPDPVPGLPVDLQPVLPRHCQQLSRHSVAHPDVPVEYREHQGHHHPLPGQRPVSLRPELCL